MQQEGEILLSTPRCVVCDPQEVKWGAGTALRFAVSLTTNGLILLKIGGFTIHGGKINAPQRFDNKAKAYRNAITTEQLDIIGGYACQLWEKEFPNIKFPEWG